MADEAKAGEKTEAPAASTGKKSRVLVFGVVGALMLMEGVGVYLITTVMSPNPAGAAADTLDAFEADQDAKYQNPPQIEYAECPVATCKPTNHRGTKLLYFNVSVSILVRKSNEEYVKALIEQNRARIEDRINVLVRRAEPKELAEPDLQTLKRQIKSELEAIFDDDQIVKEVLVPQWLQMGG